MMNKQRKYIKPKSLTWWAGAVPLVAGLILALETVLPGLGPVASVVRILTGNVAPALLVNGGLAAIGMRGAMG